MSSKLVLSRAEGKTMGQSSFGFVYKYSLASVFHVVTYLERDSGKLHVYMSCLAANIKTSKRKTVHVPKADKSTQCTDMVSFPSRMSIWSFNWMKTVYVSCTVQFKGGKVYRHIVQDLGKKFTKAIVT